MARESRGPGIGMEFCLVLGYGALILCALMFSCIVATTIR